MADARSRAPVRRGRGYVRGAGGVRVFFRGWEVASSEAIVLMVHGLGDHSGRFDETAARFNAAGISVFAPDLRGHGRSLGPRGHATSFSRYLQDLDRLRRTVEPRVPERPLFLLGHSLGGLIVLRYAQEYPAPRLRGVVGVAPFCGLAAEVPGWKLLVGELADRYAPGLTMDAGIDREILLRDSVERSRHASDPMTHRRISARLWGEMLREADRLVGRADGAAADILLQLPGHDLVVDSDAAREVAGRFRGPTEVRTYDEAYHDLYHDPLGEAAQSDALSWVRERLEA